MKDDVKDINGRNRDYLLTVWYKHTFALRENNALGLTVGIIDATAYIDENAYANCEYTQFMNQALVNAPNGFAPSYDIGGAAEWEVGSWDVTALGMNVGENDDGNNYNFFAATADLQYMEEKFKTGRDDLDGIIGGIRLTAEF
jgi:hypothetical protein